jgi:phenylacetic acid degradation operon negative regulatory protein
MGSMVSPTRQAAAVDLGKRERKGGHADLTPGSARSLLLTILGELVWPTKAPAWTSSLLYVMNGLGIEERTARQAIVRGADSGWIEPVRSGREVAWSMSAQLAEVFETGSRRVESLSDPFLEWDGNWLILLVTIPLALRTSRKKLYSGLEWAGFGNPTAGVWLTPHSERRAQVDELVTGLGLADSTMSFLGKTDSIGLSEAKIVHSGWDLDSLAQRYKEVAADFRNPEPAPGDDTLFTHIRMLSELQRLPFADPQLPEALLPNWIGRRVTTHLQQLRRTWAPDVHARWAELNAASGTSADQAD